MAEVKIVVTLDSSGAVTGVKKLGDDYSNTTKKMEADTASFSSQIKAHWLAISAAALAAYGVINKAMDYATLGAKALQIEAAYASVTQSIGVSGDALLESLKRVTAGTIAESDLMQKALKGLAQELSPDQLVRIGEMARTVAIKQGIDVQTAYQGITDSIANQMPRALKQFGLLTKEQMNLVNQAIAMGIENVDLYGMASANAAAQAAKMPIEARNAAEELQHLRAEFEKNKETIGKFIMDALMPLVKYLATVTDGIRAVVGALGGIKKPQITGMDLSEWEKGKNLQGLPGISQSVLMGTSMSTEDPAKTAAAAKAAADAMTAKLRAQVEAPKIAEAAAARIKAEMEMEQQSYQQFINLEGLKTAQLDADYKRNLVSAEDYYKARDDIALESYTAEIETINKQIAETRALYAAQQSGIVGTRPEDAAKRAQLASQEAAAIDKLYLQAGTAASKYRKGVIDDESAIQMIRDQNLGKSLQGLKAYQDAAIEARKQSLMKENQFAVDLFNQGSEIDLAAKLDIYKQQEEMYADLHDHLLMSDQDYYSALLDLNRKETEDRKKNLDAQFEYFLNKKMEELALMTVGSDEYKAQYHAIEMAAQKYYGEMDTIESNAADNAVKINRDAANKAGEAWLQFGKDASQAISDGLLNGFKDTGTQLLDAFKKLISQMIQTAVINPIIIPITQQMQGVAGGAGASVAGIGSILPGLANLGIGAGIGAIGGNSGAGALGGLAGSVLLTGAGTAGYGLIGAGLTSALGGASGTFLGMSIGSVVPVIGTIIGAVLGTAISSIFGGSKHIPSFALGYNPGQLSPDYQSTYANTGWHGQAAQSQAGYFAVNYQGMGDYSAQAQAMATGFAKATDVIRSNLKLLGVDVSGFDKGFSRYIKDTTDAQAVLDAYYKFLEQATGMTKDQLDQLFTVVAQYQQIYSNLHSAIEAEKDKLKMAGETLAQQIEEVYGKGLAAFNALATETDVNKIQQLTSTVIASIDALYAGLQQLKQGMDSVAASAQSTLQNMQISQMTDQQKVDYYNQQFQSTYAAYEQAKQHYQQFGDVGSEQAMQAIGQKLVDLANTGWGISGIDQAKTLAALTPVLNEVSDDMKSLSMTLQDQMDSLGKTLDSLDQTIQTGLATSLQSNVLAITGNTLALDNLRSAITGTPLSPSAMPSTPHASGLDYVPYNNYRASLHTGEAVLTSGGNKALSSLPGILSGIMKRLDAMDGRGGMVVVKVHPDVAGQVKIQTRTIEAARQDFKRSPQRWRNN